MHTRFLCKLLLLKYPTSTAIFVYNGAFDIARSVWNVLGCTLLHDVKLACNKHSDIACYHSLDFT